MKYHCLQIKNNDCGFACLKMLLANFHHDQNYLFLKQNLKFNEYSFLDLKKIAKKNYVDLKGYQINDLLLIKKFPCIGLIKLNNLHHYVLIEKITKNFVYYFDPSNGEKKAEIGDFKEIFTGNILLIENGENHKCNNYLKKERNLYPLIALLFNFIQIVFLFLTSFIDDNSLKMLIVLLLFLFMLIINSIINTIIIKNYDKKIIYPLIEIKQEKELIISEFTLKKDYFLYIQTVINQATILSFISFFLLINDLKNFFLLFIIFFWEWFSRKVNIFLNEHKLFKINLLESKYLIKEMKMANQLAYEISFSTNVMIVIRFLIISSGVFLICLMNNNFLPFIYYFLLSLVVDDYFNKLLNLEQKKLFLEKEILLHLHSKEDLINN